MSYKSIRKNKNCKECGVENPKGKQFCSNECAHINLLKRRKVKREANKHLRTLYNGLSKIDEIKYYKDLCNKVSSYSELLKLDTMPHKRSYSWIVKYCKPNGFISADDYVEKIQKEKTERNNERLQEISVLPYVKRIISFESKKYSALKIKFECINGHVLNRKYTDIIKQTYCTSCNYETELKQKELDKVNFEKLKKETAEASKKEKINNLIKVITDFIDSGEYKKYTNWNETPVIKEKSNLRNGWAKEYLTNDLKLKIDKITFFVYKSTGATCPYPTKENHKWCKHCEIEKHIDEFRGTNICKVCAIKYRQETYYEQDRIQRKIQYKTNPMFKLHALVKTYVLSALKGKPKTMRTNDILGIEWNEFRQYIENQFEPWMNWDNHGHGKGKWALQHIIPKAYAETEDDIYRLNYYKNLMPMDFSDNGALHDRILRYQLNEWHYDNCSDFLDKYKDRILDSMDEIYK